MKIDKDVLLKYHFWILVALALPFALVAILLLVTSVGATIDARRKELQKELSAVSGAKDPKTPDEIEKKRLEADFLEGKQTEAWDKAFKAQESLFRWPRRMERDYHISDGLFANEIELQKVPADKAGWPDGKDKKDMLYGTLVDANENGFKIQDKDGKQHQVYYTPRVMREGMKVKEPENPDKAVINYNQMHLQKDKLIAVNYQRALYFNDRLTPNQQLEYAKTYLSQVPPILLQVDPVHLETDDKGKQVVTGVVQFKGWAFDAGEYRADYDEIPAKKKDALIPPAGSKFLRCKFDDWDTNNDISDEAWIAQEDLWIQNEVYRLVRAANDSIAAFKETARDAKAGSATYQNPYFSVTLRLKDAKTLHVNIANRLTRRQKIDGLQLRLRFTKGPKAEPEVVTISGDPLEPSDAPDKKNIARDVTIGLKSGPRRDGIFACEQVLTWETAAVKRIDDIAIGSLDPSDISLSQRTMPIGLQPLVKKPADDSAAPPAGPPGAPMAGNPPMAPGPPGKPPGAPFGPGGINQPAAVNLLPNGFSPDRYQEVTPQFRRVPVAIVLIVDQNHVDRVQTAFNNSKLRFLMTQVLLNHYPQSLRPPLGDEGNPAGDMAPGAAPPRPPGAPPAPAFGPMPKGFGFPPAFAPPGFAPPGSPASPGISAGEDLEANMELVMYGVMTLYQRYPPPPAAANPTPAPEQK